MKIKLVKKEEAVIRKLNKNYQIANLLTKDSSKNVSFAVSKAKDYSEITKNTKSDRTYYVLSGKLMVKKDSQELTAFPGDLIFIPKNTEYYFGDTFKAVLINAPAFDPKDEQMQQLKQ